MADPEAARWIGRPLSRAMAWRGFLTVAGHGRSRASGCSRCSSATPAPGWSAWGRGCRRAGRGLRWAGGSCDPAGGGATRRRVGRRGGLGLRRPRLGRGDPLHRACQRRLDPGGRAARGQPAGPGPPAGAPGDAGRDLGADPRGVAVAAARACRRAGHGVGRARPRRGPAAAHRGPGAARHPPRGGGVGRPRGRLEPVRPRGGPVGLGLPAAAGGCSPGPRRSPRSRSCSTRPRSCAGAATRATSPSSPWPASPSSPRPSPRPGTRWPGPRREVVVKPVVSAGSLDTDRYPAGRHADAEAHVSRLHADGRAAMAQPYLAAVEKAGETAMVHIGVPSSHAVRKGPVLVPAAWRWWAACSWRRRSPAAATAAEREVAPRRSRPCPAARRACSTPGGPRARPGRRAARHRLSCSSPRCSSPTPPAAADLAAAIAARLTSARG